MAKNGRRGSGKRKAGNLKRPLRRSRRGGPGDLMADIRRSLATGEPLDFLAYVSTLLAALDPRAKNPFERTREQDAVTVPALVGSFAEVVLPETTALLAALAVLGPDELSRARAQRAFAARPHPVPDWLARLDETSVDRAVESTHVLGDGENVMLNVRLPGHELTMVVYIDHNLGTVVKDGFPAPVGVDEVVSRLRAASGDPDMRYGDIPLADARARISEAVEKGSYLFPPLETETWPASRPLTEWLLRLLPEGGTGYLRPEWSKAALRKLANRFFASPFGQRLDNKDNRKLLEQFLWFGTDYGPGDPQRWSPVAVEILLADWIPRKVAADPAFLAKAPALLRGFIRFCHDERGIRPSLTRETLAAVDHYEPDYQRAIRSPRPQGPEALLAAMGLLAEPDDEFPLEKFLLDELAGHVGGYDVLDSLDDAPLPDEEFAWGGVPEGAREQVRQVLDKCDQCAGALLGPEYRTACRRLLAGAAPGIPGTPLASARPELVAAGVCWVIGRANRRFGTRPGELKVKDLTGYFGITGSTASQRGYQVIQAAGLQRAEDYTVIRPAPPSLLVSERRRQIINQRDRYRTATEGLRRCAAVSILGCSSSSSSRTVACFTWHRPLNFQGVEESRSRRGAPRPVVPHNPCPERPCRDSKSPQTAALRFDRAAWSEFLTACRLSRQP